MTDETGRLRARIRDLEARLAALESENARLAERGEDTLLLSILAHHINSVDAATEIMGAGLEKISLLKDIPFSCSGRLDEGRLRITQFCFLYGDEPLVSETIDLPIELAEALAPSSMRPRGSYLLRGSGERPCPVLLFETMEFRPEAMLFVPARSVLREQDIFCFALVENGERLDHLAPLLEQVVGMIGARIDNLVLMHRMKELNRKLDRKVRERTEELARANQVLAASEKKFRGLFEEALDMIHFVDERGRIKDANPAELRTLGWSLEEIRELDIADLIDPSCYAECRKTLSRVFAGEVVRGYQTIMVARDGRLLEVEINAVPVMDDSRVVGAMAVIRDISDRRQAEEQLLKMRKMESIGVLAGGIAHDFNNILAAIMGNINLAQLHLDRDSKPHSLLVEAEKASLRARGLTGQLLTFSRGGEPVREVASLVDVIRDSAEFILRGTNVRTSYEFPDDLWPVAIDRGQISQVIQNLVINARQVMPGGGEVRISCENVVHDQPHMLPLAPGNYVRLTISDTGPGIPLSCIDRVFDPYFTTREQGNGLGLAVTHSIIAKHQGHIEAGSREGEGAVFTIHLPAADGSRPLRKEDGAKEPPRGEGKVLVMDDEEMVRTVAAGMLSEAGFDVLLARDGEEAIACVERQDRAGDPVRAVLLDLTVPGGMGGREAAAVLSRKHPGLPLIVTSGYSNDPVMARYREYGFCRAIVKPFRFDELAQAVIEALAEEK
ncbi:MAG: hypothetical protein Kow0089_21580 [Desulfobulbaceae bacterium]